MEKEQTIRCELSRIDHAGCMDTIFMQIPVNQAVLNGPIFIGEECWLISAIDSQNEANLYEAAAA